MTPSLPCDVEATVTYLPADHGGRTTPVATGYCPQFYYDGMDHGARHSYPDVERVFPGESARVFLSFIHPELQVGKLQPGKPFLIREGHRVLGYGAVTRIVDLEASAKGQCRVAS